jgi:hypothetical protein
MMLSPSSQIAWITLSSASDAPAVRTMCSGLTVCMGLKDVLKKEARLSLVEASPPSPAGTAKVCNLVNYGTVE